MYKITIIQLNIAFFFSATWACYNNQPVPWHHNVNNAPQESLEPTQYSLSSPIDQEGQLDPYDALARSSAPYHSNMYLSTTTKSSLIESIKKKPSRFSMSPDQTIYPSKNTPLYHPNQFRELSRTLDHRTTSVPSNTRSQFRTLKRPRLTQEDHIEKNNPNSFISNAAHNQCTTNTEAAPAKQSMFSTPDNISKMEERVKVLITFSESTVLQDHKIIQETLQKLFANCQAVLPKEHDISHEKLQHFLRKQLENKYATLALIVAQHNALMNEHKALQHEYICSTLDNKRTMIQKIIQLYSSVKHRCEKQPLELSIIDQINLLGLIDNFEIGFFDILALQNTLKRFLSHRFKIISMPGCKVIDEWTKKMLVYCDEAQTTLNTMSPENIDKLHHKNPIRKTPSHQTADTIPNAEDEFLKLRTKNKADIQALLKCLKYLSYSQHFLKDYALP